MKKIRLSGIKATLSTASNRYLTLIELQLTLWVMRHSGSSINPEPDQIIIILLIKNINNAYNPIPMIKINRQLYTKIEQVLVSNPKADEDTLVDKISDSGSLRMKKEAIKAGVKQYFRSKSAKINNQKKQAVVNVEDIDKPKKKVKKEKEQLEIQFEDRPEFRFEKLGGISEVLTEINNNIFLPIQKRQALKKLGIHPCKGFLLAGPVGSGKTLLANCILSYLKNSLNYNPFSVHSWQLSSADAQQNIRKLFQAAKQNIPAVILIDDIDHLCNKEANKRPQGSPIYTFLVEMEKVKESDVYFIATTSNPEKLDISFKKIHRFEKLLTLNMSSDKSRQEVLTKILQGVHHSLTQDEIIDISKSTSGFMAADLVMLVRQAGLHSLLQSMDEPILTGSNLKKSIKFVQPVMKKEGFTDIPQTTLDDVGGLKNLKLQLEREIIIPMRQQHKFKEMNFQIQSGGVLLYGPPGCGKTMLAKAIANAVRANFIIVKGPELLNKYVGESEQAVREVFGRAQRAAPCVIFFDQFDALAPKRSDQGNQVTERVVNTLLTALDGVEERKMVFVIAATNRKDMIDEATLRAGRIQKHLYVPEPNQEERVDILKAITKSMKIGSDVTFGEIAKKTQGFSGADLKFLVKEATVSAVMDNRNSVTFNDLDKSLNELLQAKNKDQLKEKVHEIQLKDDEQNESFVYHTHPSKNNVQVAVESQAPKAKSSKILQEFMDYLISREKRKK